MRGRQAIVGYCLALGVGLSGATAQEGPVSTVDDDGKVTIHQWPVPEEYRNPTEDHIEERFRHFYNEILRMETRRDDGSFGGVSGNRYAENEKRSYPSAKMHVLAGNVETGMNFLQAEDQPQNPRDNVHTKGIDLYWAFTLKGQVRKYFQFGHLMEDDYRERMGEAIRLWTESHPRHTPHPEYGRYDPNAQGWGPNRFGHRQVDGRRTDNLFAMSTTSIYLFAEASENEETRQRAKSELLGYVWALFNIGHGEWDSIAYHSHIVAPFLNLYDFAEDPEVKMAAKLALDHFFVSAALKWQRATFLGASKRDYGGGSYHQMGNGFTHFFNLYFQDKDEVHREPDQVHAMTSSYRPPPAVRALAARDFDRPVEILATKPQYENWQEGRSDRPHNFETLYIARHGGMGSAADPGGNGDMAPFRVVLNRGENDTDVVAIAPDRQLNTKRRGSQTAQYKNLLVWMSDRRDHPWHLYRGQGTTMEEHDGVTFIKSDRSWLAIRRHGVGDFQEHEVSGRRTLGNPDAKWSTAEHEADWNLIAIEYGEEGDFDSFAAFRDAVLNDGSMEVDADQRQVVLTGANGRVLETHYNSENDLPVLIRDGEARDWNDPAEWALWRTTGDQNVVSLGWKEGHLLVEAGGHTFEAQFALDDFTGPEVTREQLERERALTATSSFENR